MTCIHNGGAMLPPRDRFASDFKFGLGPARPRPLLAALLAMSVLVATRSVRADEASDTAMARVLGQEGLILADQGRCARAIAQLQRAEALHHAPSTATRLGECEIETGKVVAGTERLQRVVREPLPPNAPAPFVAAVARAQRDLDKAVPKIAMLRISVGGAPAGIKPVITLDGESLPEAVLLSADRPTDPGNHVVQATASGFLNQLLVSVSLGEGESKSITLELQTGPSVRTPSFEPSSASRAESAPASKVLGFTALGLGVAGLALGAVAGGIVATKSSALSNGCGANRVCPASQQAALNGARTWATVSDVAFESPGESALGSGVLLLLLAKPTAIASDDGRVGLSIGPASVSVSGAF